MLPARRDGTVLLLCTPPLVGVFGVANASDFLLCLLATETFRRMLPNFRTLSAPALALELDRPMVFDRDVLGLPDCFTGVPLCTSRTVSGLQLSLACQ